MHFNNSSGDGLIHLPEMTSQSATSGVSAHTVVLNILRVLIGWLIMANMIIIVCFMLNRHKHWPLFSVQILCSSVCDMVTGFAIVPFGIGMLMEPQSRLTCATIMYAFIASQLGSMLNLFCVCVYRFLRIEKVKRQSEPRVFRRVPAYMAIASWVVSLKICVIPFVVWNRPLNEQIPFCVIGYPFTNVRGAMTYFASVLFIPQFSTNVLYVVSYLRLRYIIGRGIFPSAANQAARETRTTSTGINNHTARRTNQSARNASRDTIEDGPNFVRMNTRIQERVLKTIGLVMILFNICTLPMICVFFLGITDIHKNVRFVVSMIFIFHSVLNPIIYGLRSSWLTLALKKMFSDFKRTVLCST